ncbi:MAG: hypothetical protein NZ954_06570 [Thermofilaceae archaeon]|nr:hypothetical protein [Thermofilaceae archaeon]MDW8003740.1 hypothetical protein [Thermofilaceae archaeon]
MQSQGNGKQEKIVEKIVCSVCGKATPIAKIAGKYYCFTCGNKIVKEHIVGLLKDLERKGFIQSTSHEEDL